MANLCINFSYALRIQLNIIEYWNVTLKIGVTALPQLIPSWHHPITTKHTSLIKPKLRKRSLKEHKHHHASSSSLLPLRNSFLFSQALVELPLLLVDGSEFASLILQSHNGIIHLIQYRHKHYISILSKTSMFFIDERINRKK